MRKFVIAFTLCISGCTGNSHHEANQLIVDYVRKISNDPSSYEPVSFSAPRAYTSGDLLHGVPSGKTISPGVVITHAYRGKNSFGALVLNTSSFMVDSAVKYVQVLPEPDEEGKRRQIEEMVTRMEHQADSAANAKSR